MKVQARLSVLIALAMLSLAGGVSAGETKVGGTATPAKSTAKSTPSSTALIDINSASRAQLKTLPWIGDAEAARIIAGRPYTSKASLVAEKIIPAGVYQSIRHRIIAIQKSPPGHPAPPPGKPADSTV